MSDLLYKEIDLDGLILSVIVASQVPVRIHTLRLRFPRARSVFEAVRMSGHDMDLLRRKVLAAIAEADPLEPTIHYWVDI